MPRVPALRSGTFAAFAYLLLALALTWPLASDLARLVPGDLGDPLLNMWILGWDLDHLGRFITGEGGAFHGFWNANIFHPAPLALAYSEHLVPLAVQVLPVYLLTHNLVLCYNLLFLATFVLSALGTFLLARALTRSGGAAFVAGAMYGFALYRIDQLGHLQVLTSQWMPFALLGLWRFAETRRRAALAWAGLALLVQGLSCGYYLFFFWPFAAAFAAWALWRHGRMADGDAWRALALTAAAVCVCALPFLVPYAQLRTSGALVRSSGELAYFSADMRAFVRTDRSVRVWSGLHQKDSAPMEGDLFPGLVPIVLGALGVLSAVRRARVARDGGLARALLAQPGIACGLAALTAASLALGPTLRVAGHALAPGPYAALYRLVPGFDALRVPSRFGMLVALFAALAAAEGARWLGGRAGGVLPWVATVLFLIEGTALPLRTNQILRDPGLRKLPPLELPAPAIYRAVQRLPCDAVLLELPLGGSAHDVRAVFHSTTHWRRLVNGYSGAQPPDYRRLALQLRELPEPSETAWAALTGSGATHVLVHEAAWREPRGAEISAWLLAHGARRLAGEARDVLFALPEVSPRVRCQPCGTPGAEMGAGRRPRLS